MEKEDVPMNNHSNHQDQLNLKDGDQVIDQVFSIEFPDPVTFLI